LSLRAVPLSDSSEPLPIPFVGREELMATLRGSLQRARTGDGAVVCLTGEAGMGKTRAAHELARLAAAEGLEVHRGAGYEGQGAPPYWPWVELLRSLLRGRSLDALSAELGPATIGLLTSLLPELGESASARVDGEAMRFRLWDAVTRFLHAEARERPLVLVFDDLHWADSSSIGLLEFFGREVARAPVLLLAATRDPGAEDNPALQAVLARMARLDAFVACSLEGLSAREIGILTTSLTGAQPVEDLVRFLDDKTRGNPFFVKEMVSLLAATRRLDAPGGSERCRAVPDTVRSVVQQRLERLPGECRELLRLAAVMGTGFDVRVLAEAAGATPTALEDALAPARQAQLFADARPPYELAFAHPLIRDGLLLEPDAETRRALHRKVALVLEARADRDEASLGALARHCLEAVPEIEASRAIGHGRRAAAHARHVFAFEEAAALSARMLELVEPADRMLRGELLLELGAAQLRAGQSDAGRASTLEAAALARRAGDPEALARAALQYATGQLVVGVRNEPVIELLTEALEGLPAPHPQRILLMAQLATFYLSAPDHERAAPLLAEALREARANDDREGELACLAAELYVLGGPGNIRGRIGAADRLIELAGPEGPPATVAFARNFRTLALLEAGDINGVDRAIREMEVSAERNHDLAARPFALRYRATRALLDGRLEEAERLSMEAFELAGRIGLGETASMNLAAQIFMLRRHQGRLEELMPMLQGFVAQFPDFVSWHSALSLLYVELGRYDDARAVLLSVVDLVPDLPRDLTWLTTVSGLAEVCAVVEEREHLALFYELLRPFHASQVVVGNGDSTTGSVSRVLGLLAAAAGRVDDAKRHFEDAIAMNRRMGALPFLAYTLRDAAAAFEAGGEPERARAQRAEARGIAATLGMRELEGTAPDEHARAPSSPRIGVFREEGDHWLVGLGDALTPLRDSRGLQQIARLLREPGREFHVLDLANVGVPLERVRRTRAEQARREGDAGPHLDATARAAYVERLRALRDDVAGAEARNDVGRREEAQREIAFLEQELARGFGLGGRERRAGSAAERARVNVARTIARALDRIREANPAAGRALDRCVRTGSFCAFEPDPDFPIEWKL